MTEVSDMSQAERLFKALYEQGTEIDNVFVVFSRKGVPESITVGTTGHTPVMWTLGAMEYARWHLFNVLTMGRQAAEGATEQAVAEQALLAAHGVKPS